MPDYIDNTYKALKEKVQGFDRTPEDYRKLISSDKQYRKNVFDALSQKVGGFNRSEEDFDGLVLNVPKTEIKKEKIGPVPSFKEFAKEKGVVTEFAKPVSDIPAPDLALMAKQSEQIEKNRKEAIDSTISKKLTSEGLKFKKDDATWKKTEASIRKNIQDGVLSMSVSNVGTPIYKRSLAPFEALVNSLNAYNKEETEAVDFVNMSNKERVAYDDRLQAQEAEGVASTGLAKIFEGVGQMAIPITTMIGGAMVGSALPGAGTIGGAVGGFLAGLPGAYTIGGKQNSLRLYRKSLEELKAQGVEITEKVKEDEMQKAMGQYGVGGMASVAANVPIFPISPAISNTFKSAIVQATKNTTFDLATQVPLAGVSSIAQDVSAKQAGYNIKAAEMFQNAWDMSSEAAKVIVALNVGHNLNIVPKYVASATKEFLNSFPKLDLNNMSKAMEAQGLAPEGSTEVLMDGLSSYDNARSKVPNIVPEEYMPSMAGLMEKRSNLEAQKTPDNKPFHAKIDEQISAIDKRIEMMQESPNPILDEVDDLTGDTGEATPFREEEAVKASEFELGVPIEKAPAPDEVARLRAEEERELSVAIPNIDEYKVDGVVDRTKITNAEDRAKFDEIYNKYDKLISPLLEAPKSEAALIATEKAEEVPEKAKPIKPEKALSASTLRQKTLNEQRAIIEEIGEPTSARQAVMKALIGGRKVNTESLRQESGLSNEKRKIKGRMQSELSRKTFTSDNAKSISRVAEDIWFDATDGGEISLFTDSDARSELIDILVEYDDIPTLRDAYIKEYYKDYDKMAEDYFSNLREEVDPIEKEWQDWSAEQGEKDMALELDEDYVRQLILKEYGEEPTAVTKGAPEGEARPIGEEIGKIDVSEEARDAAGTIRTEADVAEVTTYDTFRKEQISRKDFDSEFNKNRYDFESKEDYIRRKFCE